MIARRTGLRRLGLAQDERPGRPYRQRRRRAGRALSLRPRLPRKENRPPRQPDLDGRADGRHRPPVLFAQPGTAPGRARTSLHADGHDGRPDLPHPASRRRLLLHSPSVRSTGGPARPPSLWARAAARRVDRPARSPLPSLLAVLAGFARAISEVGIAMMLGGNIRGATRNITTSIARNGQGRIPERRRTRRSPPRHHARHQHPRPDGTPRPRRRVLR